MSYSKPKSAMSNVFLMIAILAIVVVLMFIVNRKKTTFPSFTNALNKFKGQAEVINNRYYNRPFRFSISAPDSNWHFQYSTQIDSLFTLGSSDTNPKVIVQFSRLDQQDTSVVVKVGLFNEKGQVTLEGIARRNLSMVQEKYKTKNEPVIILGDVTVAGSASLSSAFHVVEFPSQTTYPYPIWVTMHVIRNQLVYQILCQAKRNQYENYRTDLEYILKSFSFL